MTDKINKKCFVNHKVDLNQFLKIFTIIGNLSL